MHTLPMVLHRGFGHGGFIPQEPQAQVCQPADRCSTDLRRAEMQPRGIPAVQLECARIAGPATIRAPVWFTYSMGPVQALAMPSRTPGVLLLRAALLSALCLQPAPAKSTGPTPPGTPVRTSPSTEPAATLGATEWRRGARWMQAHARTCRGRGGLSARAPTICAVPTETPQPSTHVRSPHIWQYPGAAMATALTPR